MIPLSTITSYLTCPRLCYYRINYGESVFTEYQAIREIYLSLRMGFDLEWARNRAESVNDDFDPEIFDNAAKKFIFKQFLNDLKPVDWDVVVKSDKLGIVAIIDEIVEFDGVKTPLFVGLNAPDKNVWFKDAIKIAAVSLASNYGKGLIYYAYSGELRKLDVSFGLRRKALKLIERVKMVSKGFLPERRESKYCEFCSFADECNRQPETFASRFL